MKAMLLAAGFGGRMVPITFFRAKPALPFLNRPLLLRQLDHLAAAGIDEVVINLHHRPDSLLALLAGAAGEDQESKLFRIGSLQVRVCHEPEILGTSGGLLGAAAHLAGDEPFLCLNADFVCDIDLGAAVETHRRSGRDATLVLRPATDGDRFTPVWHDGHRVLAFGDPPDSDAARPSGATGSAVARATARAPSSSPPHLAAAVFTGIHVLEPRVLEALPAGRSEFLPALYAPMIAAGTGPGVHLSDAAWYEVGTPERYLDAQIALLPAGRIGVHRPWTSAHTVAHGPTGGAAAILMGDRCRVHPEAFLGAGTILGDDVQVAAAAHIERSVVLDGASVGAGARLREVIVGPDTCIPPQADLSHAVVDRGVTPDDIPSRKCTPRRWEGLWRADF